MKKVLTYLLSMVMVAALAIGGTLAYLQDTDEDVNVMTMGNVQIEQHEYERKVDADGNYTTIDVDGTKSYELVEFTQGKPLYPVVGNVMGGYDATEVRLGQLGHNSRGGMQVLPVNNVQDKFVVVENTGKSDAYVRTIVAFEAGSVVEEDWYKIVSYSSHFTWKETHDWFVTEIDGNNYYLVEFVYNGYENIQHPNGVLKPGDYTYNNLAQVYMFNTATNKDVEALDGNNNGTFDIMVLSQAVQTNGFDNAKTALDTAFGEFNATNVKEWFKNMGKVQFVEANGKKDAISGTTAEKYLNDLKEGNNLIVDNDVDIINFETNNLDAKNATVTLNGLGSDAYGYLAILPETNEQVNVSNLNVTGKGFVELGDYSVQGGTYSVENLTVKDMTTTLAVNNGSHKVTAAFAHYGKATLNNCVMTGTVSGAEGYNAYDAGFVNTTKTTINGGKYGSMYIWNQAHVTINGAEVGVIDSAAITASNLGKLTIGAGTHVDEINLIPGSYKPALVIEAGATVDKITYNGESFTQEEWLNK